MILNLSALLTNITITLQHKEISMKKLLVALVSLGLLAPAAVFAVSLDTVAGIKLTNQVSGTYFSSTDKSKYELSAGHLKGNRVYASGSLDQKIFYKELATGVVVQSSDLISSYGGSTTTDGSFDSDAAWTAL
jgi:hypothetical protein